MRMTETWRWFGPNDPVSLQDIKQTGAKGIVTALHHIPHGEIWPVEEIRKRKDELAKHDFPWTVVESVTVHEDIKSRSGNYKAYIENYKETLRNLAACDIKVVTYNFMPVNDWTRTSLDYPMADNSKALYFNWSDLALFDIFILKRQNASADYTDAVLKEAEEKHQSYSEVQLEALANTVMFGIPGEAKITVERLQERLKPYADISRDDLRENLKYFLNEIAPVADELSIRLAIHPDDPPFNIFGLPRIVSNADDVNYILNASSAKSNGLCFCTGSYGAAEANNLTEMIKSAGERIHFVHFRNTKRDEKGNFYEADHLAGDTDMYAVMKEVLNIRQQVDYAIPFRPDHGHQMLYDMDKETNPGYSCIGRMRGLAELRGLMMGIERAL